MKNSHFPWLPHRITEQRKVRKSPKYQGKTAQKRAQYGIEVYNGNFHWAQEPEKIEGILRRHPEYIQISASDFHEVGHLASGGVVLDRPVKTSAELKDALLDKGIVELIRR